MPMHQTLAQSGTQVLHLILVYGQIGMACYPKLRELLDHAAFKQLAQMGAYHAGQSDKDGLGARHFFWQTDDSRQHARHLDDRDLIAASKSVLAP